MHRNLYGTNRTIDEKCLAEVLRVEYERVGAGELMTPREIIRDFIEFLNILAQHSDLTPEALLASDEFHSAPAAAAGRPDDDQFVEFDI